MQNKLKKQITYINTQRILQQNSFLLCFSNVNRNQNYGDQKFIANFIFNLLCLNEFPKNTLARNSFNFHALKNHFFNFLTFSKFKQLISHINNLNVFTKPQLLFVKVNNLYILKDFNFFLSYSVLYHILNKLYSLLFNYLNILNFFIKKKVASKSLEN